MELNATAGPREMRIWIKDVPLLHPDMFQFPAWFLDQCSSLRCKTAAGDALARLLLFAKPRASSPADVRRPTGDASAGRCLQELAEGWALQMRRSWTFGHVPKGIPQHPKVEHLPLQIIRFGMQLIAGNVGPVALPEHAGDLGKGEACGFPELDQGQFQENVGIELPPQPMSADRSDQADLLVVAQRRGRHARSFGHLTNVHHSHA